MDAVNFAGETGSMRLPSEKYGKHRRQKITDLNSGRISGGGVTTHSATSLAYRFKAIKALNKTVKFIFL